MVETVEWIGVVWVGMGVGGGGVNGWDCGVDRRGLGWGGVG